MCTLERLELKATSDAARRELGNLICHFLLTTIIAIACNRRGKKNSCKIEKFSNFSSIIIFFKYHYQFKPIDEIRILERAKLLIPVFKIFLSRCSPFSNPLCPREVELIAESRRQDVVEKITEIQVIRILHQDRASPVYFVLRFVDLYPVLLPSARCNNESHPR